MTTVKKSIIIQAPTEEVWNVLADFGGIQVFHPGLHASRQLTASNSGLGAERQCDLDDSGTWIRERIIDWTDGQSFTLEIFDGKKTPPFRTATTSFSVTPATTGSRVALQLDYELKGGPIGRLMDRALVRGRLGPALDGLLAGLKRHVETGETVTASTPLDHGAVRQAA